MPHPTSCPQPPSCPLAVPPLWALSLGLWLAIGTSAASSIALLLLWGLSLSGPGDCRARRQSAGTVPHLSHSVAAIPMRRHGFGSVA